MTIFTLVVKIVSRLTAFVRPITYLQLHMAVSACSPKISSFYRDFGHRTRWRDMQHGKKNMLTKKYSNVLSV